MATYVIGDIHGCFETLQRLLLKMSWDPAVDELWLVGDLVNRGPASLEVLRWAVAHDEKITAVLGNHDLHLLARAAGLVAAKADDTLDDVLAAPDRDELLGWLRRRPFLHVRGTWVMVHAGLLPGWDVGRALGLAEAAAEGLGGDRWPSFLRRVLAKGSRREGMPGDDDATAAVGVFTRLRMVDGDGRPRFSYTGPVEEAPKGYRPWYGTARVISDGSRVVFGHWAALGVRRGEGMTCLDSGCVYGNRLSALRLDDDCVFEQETVDPVPVWEG